MPAKKNSPKPSTKVSAAKAVRPAAKKPAAPERPAQSRPVPEAPASTYFLIVSPHERGGRRFVRLKSPTVLAWFQRMWGSTEEQREGELRGPVYGLDSFFDKTADEGLSCPTSDAELLPLLERHVYSEGGIEAEPHFLAVETDDDEVAIEYYFFDEAFLAADDALDRLPSSRLPRSDDEEREDDFELGGDDEEEADAWARFLAERSDE
ncbi:MAG: hypothetical protein QM765_45840 [Myxococcales bacterium]